MVELYQSADWKKEKHMPVIECSDLLKKDTSTIINVSVGKEIAHPNTTVHHICWIQLIFWAEGAKFPVEIGKVEFTAHGASAEGPDKGTIYTDPVGLFMFKTGKPGKLIATSFCNIHGFWKSEKDIKVE